MPFNRKHWTAKEDIKLLALYRNHTLMELSNILNRSYGGIKARKEKLRITTPRVANWSKKEDKKLEQLFKKGYGVQTIANELNRSFGATTNRIFKLNLKRPKIKGLRSVQSDYPS